MSPERIDVVSDGEPFLIVWSDGLPDGAFEEECVLWYDRQSVPQLGISCAHKKGRKTSRV